VKLNKQASKIRTIKNDSKDWYLYDGPVMAPRAGFEISQSTPREYRMILEQCINMGYIKPVAFVKDSQLFWEEFQK
jgi:hypothetical protein